MAVLASATKLAFSLVIMTVNTLDSSPVEIRFKDFETLSLCKSAEQFLLDKETLKRYDRARGGLVETGCIRRSNVSEGQRGYEEANKDKADNEVYLKY